MSPSPSVPADPIELPPYPSIDSRRLSVCRTILLRAIAVCRLVSPAHDGLRPQDEGEDRAANEFLLSCAKFSTQLEQAISQVSGDVQLKMPDIPDLLERSNDSVAQEESLMVQLESCIDQWTPAITDLLELQGRQKPKGPGPLAEVDFWRAKAAALGTVYEQLNLPTVRKLLEIMSEFLPHQYEQFKAHHNELSKQYIEAKDNVKFLTTLERYSALEYSSAWCHLQNDAMRLLQPLQEPHPRLTRLDPGDAPVDDERDPHGVCDTPNGYGLSVGITLACHRCG